jgi:polyribonucleotide nucleotidyltransferase
MALHPIQSHLTQKVSHKETMSKPEGWLECPPRRNNDRNDRGRSLDYRRGGGRRDDRRRDDRPRRDKSDD